MPGNADFAPDSRDAAVLADEEGRAVDAHVFLAVHALLDPGAERKVGVIVQLAETAAAVRTVQTLVDSYKTVRSPRWRPATVKAFEIDLRTIADALGSVPVDKVSRRMLAGFLRGFVDEQVAEGRRDTRA